MFLGSFSDECDAKADPTILLVTSAVLRRHDRSCRHARAVRPRNGDTCGSRRPKNCPRRVHWCIIRYLGSITMTSRITHFIVLIITFSVAATGMGAAQNTPTTEHFMNTLSTCAGSMDLKVDTNILGSIRSLYEGQRTQGRIVFKNAPIFLNLFPESKRTTAYKLYINCVTGILGLSSKTRTPFCDQAVIDRCRNDARARSATVLRSCRRVIECEPDNYLAYSRISQAHRNLRQWTEAEDAANKQLQIGQRFDDRSIVSQAYYNIATIYYKKGLFERAETYARRSLEYNDRSDVGRGAFHRLLGDISLKRSDLIAAESHFTRSIEFFKKSANNLGLAAAYTSLSYARFRRRDRAGACRYLRSAREIYEEANLFERIGKVSGYMRRARCN